MLIRFTPDPHLCYVTSFGVAFIVYMAGWSELYPPLRPPLIGFLLLTFVIHLWFSRMLRKRASIVIQSPDPSGRSPVYITAFIYSLWAMEFVYEGGIPLFKIIFAVPYDYRFFGIPSLHVFVVTFSSFYTVYLFQVYLTRRKRMLLLLCLVNLAAAILIYNRGMLLFNLAASLVVYLTSKGGLSLRHLAISGVAILIILYFFGVLGTLRVSRLAGQPYNNESFLETGGATEEFRKSILPKEYFWAYIYISSPLANLQQNIILQSPDPPTPGNIAKMINSEIFPDFISKRISSVLELRPQTDSRIPGPFTASTIYSRSFSYAGWAGLSLMAVFLVVAPLAFIRLLPVSSRFFLSGWAILCTMYLFSVFDNTFRFTGLSFQLAYPILLHWIDRKSNRLTQVF